MICHVTPETETI